MPNFVNLIRDDVDLDGLVDQVRKLWYDVGRVWWDVMLYIFLAPQIGVSTVSTHLREFFFPPLPISSCKKILSYITT